MFSYSKSLKLYLANGKGSINTAIKGLKCKSRYSKNSSVSAPGGAEYARPHPHTHTPPPASPRGEAAALSLNWRSQTTRAAEGTLGLLQGTAHLLPTPARARALGKHNSASSCPLPSPETQHPTATGPRPASGAQSPQSSRRQGKTGKRGCAPLKCCRLKSRETRPLNLEVPGTSCQTEVGGSTKLLA